METENWGKKIKSKYVHSPAYMNSHEYVFLKGGVEGERGKGRKEKEKKHRREGREIEKEGRREGQKKEGKKGT